MGGRTGLAIKRCEVGNINFLRDTAEVKIYDDDPQKVGDLDWFDKGTDALAQLLTSD